MNNNEECQLIVNQNNKKKIIKVQSEIENSLLKSRLKNALTGLLVLIFILIFTYFIIKIKYFLYPFFSTSNDIKSNDIYPPINNTLINELNSIIKSFEINTTNNNIIQNNNKILISQNPKISVIIPIYNNAEKIGLTVHSIQKQNLIDIEIIIIDDNSEDNSIKTIEQFQQEDPRIKLLKNKNNRGILYTRSIGVLNSKGKYIFPINSGDVFINDIFNICYDEAELNFLDIIEFSGYNFSYYNSNLNISPTPIQNFLNYKTDGQIIMQPELSNFIYREKNDSIGYEIIDELIFGKCIKTNIYKNTIDLLNSFIFSEKLFFYESQVINFALFKIANSFKFINKNGIIHIHKEKIINNKNQYFHDKLKYAMSLYKITQNSKNVKISIFEFENALNLYSSDINEDNKKLVNDAFKEINECKFITDDKRKALEIKVRNIINN